jgi:serine/threonine protein kinase
MTPQDPRGWSAANSSVRPLEPDDPVTVGPQRLLGRLGEGGMGVVYLGLDSTGRKVAIKVIRGDLARNPVFRARFDAEVANAQRVASFCTARVLDHGEADGVPYLVTEYIEGPSLTDYINAHGGFPPGALRSLAVGVATALTAIHAVRLVHRDLKPRNVLLAPDAPRVIDFGIARALDSDARHTRTGAVIGSPGYIAPEQAFDGQVSTAADIFAWGTLVAYAATGRNPFGTGSLMVLAARAKQAKYDLSGVPKDLQPMIRAALHPDPARRPTADALLVELVGEQAPERAATDLIHNEWRTESGRPPARAGHRRSTASAGTVAPRSQRTRTWVVAGVAAGVAAGVTALVIFGSLGTDFSLVGRDASDDRTSAPPVAAPATTVPPAPQSSSPTPSPSSPSPQPTETSDEPKPTQPTPTAPTKRWRVVGPQNRLIDYCADLGHGGVTYSDDGLKWWCEGTGDTWHLIDLEESCRWHYPLHREIRPAKRRSSGAEFKYEPVCEVYR